MAPAASTRRTRERDIVAATRALFDERGVQDAPIDEIARAVGINKALIYRVFSSKEELFVLTVTHYLDELRELAPEPHEGLRDALDRFTRFCLRYPAFLDCALSLMRRPAAELRERVGEGTWLRLGASMSACLAPLARILARRGRRGPGLRRQPALHAGARDDAPRPHRPRGAARRRRACPAPSRWTRRPSGPPASTDALARLSAASADAWITSPCSCQFFPSNS